MSGVQDSKKALQISQNIKKTALGSKFVKTLYLEPEKLNAKTTTLILKQLGLEIPEGVLIANDAAQVMVSGQAIAEGLEAGKTLNDMQGSVSLTASSFRALTAVGEKNKWVDEDSASLIRIGTSVTMLVASFGTDISSWVALALELSNTVAVKQGLADVNAILDAQNKYKDRISPQAKILGDTFKDFQEKNISIYGVIAKMAVETPDLWPQVITPGSPIVQNFPDLMMLPTTGASVRGVGSAEMWGNWPWPASGRYVLARWNADKIIDFQTLGVNFNKETAAEFFFEILLKPWLAVYAKANDEIISAGNMSMANIAALSYMVKPDGEISDQYDYVSMLQGSCLTPYDFNDPILDNIAAQFLKDSYQNVDTKFYEQAISFGVSGKNQGFVAYNKDLDAMRIKLEQLRASDDISILTKYPYIAKKLQTYMDFQQTSFERDPTLGGRLNEKFQEKSVRAWRKLHNYFAVVQMLDTFRKDSYLSTTHYAQQLYPFMPSIEMFDATVKRINYLSTVRSVNRLALANIANMLGTSVNKLQRLTPVEEMGATKFAIK